MTWKTFSEHSIEIMTARSRLLEVFIFAFLFSSVVPQPSRAWFQISNDPILWSSCCKICIDSIESLCFLLNLEDFCKNSTCKMFQKIIILGILGLIVHIFPLRYRGVGEVGNI